MPQSNENSQFVCAFLDGHDFNDVHSKFVEAFSDYYIQFKLSEQQFRNHITLNAVDLGRSIGCFDDGRLVGLTLNGFGDWDGVPTIYDAGTGVIPTHRRRGMSEAMFEKMFPLFKSEGYRQCLLEVISRNEPAIRLYEKLGFERTRSLYLMQASDIRTSSRTPDGVEFRELERPDMCHMASFGDEKPSWQNSVEAVRRSILMKRVIGAFDGDECVGYLVYSAGVARVSQIAVRPDHRRRGIGSGLLSRMLTDLRPGFEPQVINIDARAADAVAFFESRGFGVVLEQYEMLKVL